MQGVTKVAKINAEKKCKKKQTIMNNEYTGMHRNHKQRKFCRITIEVSLFTYKQV